MLHLRMPVFSVSVTVAFPSSLIRRTPQHPDVRSPDVMGNSLASLGRALRVRKTAVRRDHFQLRLLDLHQTDGHELLNQVGPRTTITR